MKLILVIFMLMVITTAKAQTDTTRKAITSDSIYTKAQIEPQMPGGPDAWIRFLNNCKLKPATGPAEKVATVSFLVAANGHTSDFKIEGTTSMDKALLKNIGTMIQKLVIFAPAVQNGKNVPFRAIRYITLL